jgi:hypothetical protein
MFDSHMDASHPTWIGDWPTWDEFPTKSHLAGADSRESLDAWFDGWTDVLDRNGFKVVEYEVPAENVMVGRSGLQVAFLPVKE